MTDVNINGGILRISEGATTVVDIMMNQFKSTQGMLLLLPYCAKKPSCPWRQKQGCIQCGECTIGEAYQMAVKSGMIPISINNYEELKDVLTTYKAKSCPGFVGCCCDSFYAKHERDFQDIGLPGILLNINNETCYDLGKEDEAKQGKYQRQTDLKLSLVRQVLACLNNAGELSCAETG